MQRVVKEAILLTIWYQFQVKYEACGKNKNTNNVYLAIWNFSKLGHISNLISRLCSTPGPVRHVQILMKLLIWFCLIFILRSPYQNDKKLKQLRKFRIEATSHQTARKLEQQNTNTKMEYNLRFQIVCHYSSRLLLSCLNQPWVTSP